MKPVRMYTSQVCPFCIRAKALLRQRGVAQIDEVRVDLEPEQRVRMIELTGRRTVPQIFIGDTHVGGCDELVALDQRGGLMPLLAGMKIDPQAQLRARARPGLHARPFQQALAARRCWRTSGFTVGDNRTQPGPNQWPASTAGRFISRKPSPWPTPIRTPCSRSSACT